MTEQELFETIRKQKESGKNYGQIAGWLRKNANPPRLIISDPTKKKISYSWDAPSVSNFMISKGYRVMLFTTRNHKVKTRKETVTREEKPVKSKDLFLKIAQIGSFSLEEKKQLLKALL